MIQRMFGYAPIIGIAMAAGAVSAQAPLDTTDLLERGRAIYETGRLGSGAPLAGLRQGGVVSKGEAAACIRCHQRSGFGVFEGLNLVPPITGPSLFANWRPEGHTPRRAKSVQHQPSPFRTRPSYDNATIARALRDGISSSGHRFQFLMPRYALNNSDMTALTAYLRQLSTVPSLGVNSKQATFATVIAPAQDRARRDAVLDVLRTCFRERHPEGRAAQAWNLEVWDLQDNPANWEQQLEVLYRQNPPFALVSGLGGDEWSPVHRFCEAKQLPCLFPNIDAVPDTLRGRYSFYFSKGVVLEAEVAARYLALRTSALGLRRVVQVGLQDGAGAKAAEALRAALQGTSLTVEDRIWHTGENQALGDLGTSDALIVWLPKSEVVQLTTAAPPDAGIILLSGWLGGWERAPLPASWKRSSLMVYSIDAPTRRDARMSFNLRPWLAANSIPQTDEPLQGNTLAACNLLYEGVLRLRGAYFREYLIERIENYPTGMGNAPASQAYPRFSIAPGQRFSSTGAYIVKFKTPDTTDLELVHQWLVPN